MGIKNTITSRTAKGFTIVEIIVVVIVIGILVGVATIGYGSWRKDVTQKQLASELTQAAAAMEGVKNFSNGYPLTLPTTFKSTDGVTVSYARGTAKSFCIEAVSAAQPSLIYYYDSLQKGVPKAGTCPAVFTNLVKNPQPTDATKYQTSSASVGEVTFQEGAQGKAARMTRLTTAALALYIERATGGTMVALAGDVYTVKYTIISPITTTISAQIGYGGPTSTSALGGATTTAVNLTAGVASDVSYTFTVPSGFNGQPLFPKLLWSTGAAADYFEVSKVMVVKGTYPAGSAYADGDSGSGWIWEGPANNSTSTGPSL